MADAVAGAFSPSGRRCALRLPAAAAASETHYSLRSAVTFYASDASLPADRGEMSPYAVATVGGDGGGRRGHGERWGAMGGKERA